MAYRFFVTAPPTTAGFRMPAEYEPSQAYLLNWMAYGQPKWKKLFGKVKSNTDCWLKINQISSLRLMLKGDFFLSANHIANCSGKLKKNLSTTNLCRWSIKTIEIQQPKRWKSFFSRRRSSIYGRTGK